MAFIQNCALLLRPELHGTEAQHEQTNDSPTALGQIRPLMGNRKTLTQLALAFNPTDPPCERAVRNLMDQLQVPFVKVLGARWYDPDVVQAAIVAREVNRQPRKPGRPRKAA